jgi:DNA repair ATPase RecN
LLDQIDKITEQLSEPERKYQEYLEKLKKWEDNKKQIEGNENTKDTLKWLGKEIKYIKEQAQNDLDKIRNNRFNLVHGIYKKKVELVNIYKNFKNAVDKEISKFQDILGEYEITIDASLKLNQIVKILNRKILFERGIVLFYE